MANYRAVARHYPAALDYLRQAKWSRRGDVLAYTAGLRRAAFSTDQFGFRHTRFEGRDLSLTDAGQLPGFAILLGSSHVFGFGLAGNEETLASRLSESLGYPVFGVSFPEADSRTLCATLQRVLREFSPRVKLVLLATGGDFTRYCYSGLCDPVFGPPVLPRDERASGSVTGDIQFEYLTRFSAWWVEQIAMASARGGAPFALIEDLTFFEKPAPDAIETECGLGVAHDEALATRFAIHKAGVYRFGDARRDHAAAAGLSLIKFPPQAEVRFVDEFHYRADSIVEIAEKIAGELSRP